MLVPFPSDERRSALEMGFDLLRQALDPGPHVAVNLLPVLEEDQGGDAHDPVPPWGLGVGVHVHLGHPEPPGILAGPLLHHGRDGPAGHAPVSPKVDQNGKVGLEYLLFKIGVGHVQHSAVLTHPFPSLRFQPSQAETVRRPFHYTSGQPRRPGGPRVPAARDPRRPGRPGPVLAPRGQPWYSESEVHSGSGRCPATSRMVPEGEALVEQARHQGFRVPPPTKVAIPLIDVHTHAFPDRPTHELVEAAELYQVERLVALASLEQSVEVQSQFPHMVLPGPMLDFTHWQDPDRFAATNIAVVREAARAGAPLIKLWFAPRFQDRVPMKLDDARLDPIFEEIGRQKLAVLVHVADPDIWFAKYYTDTARYGTKADQYPPLEYRLERHPEIVFISAHMGGDPEHLDHLAELMDRYPNYHVEIGRASCRERV